MSVFKKRENALQKVAIDWLRQIDNFWEAATHLVLARDLCLIIKCLKNRFKTKKKVER